MTSLLPPPVRSLPVLTTGDVSWRCLGRNLVEIRIDLRNDGVGPTEPGTLLVGAAAFGAFLPPRPVARIAVGGLDPGERRIVRARVSRAGLPPPPALPSGLFSRKLGEFFDLLRHAEWAGNLDIRFDRAPELGVEMHRAFGLKILPGRPVAFMFGIPRESAYRIAAEASRPDWSVRLARPSSGIAFVLIQPPAEPGSRAEVEVRVTRERDGRTVPVEFSLETVGARGGSLGCIQV